MARLTRMIAALTAATLALGCASRPKEPDALRDATGQAASKADAVANSDHQPAVMDAALTATTGEVEAFVRWPRVPGALLRPGPLAGARRCGEPLPPAVSVDAAFGVRDVVVFVEAAATDGATASAASAFPPATTETRVVLGPCDPQPTIVVATAGDLLLYNQGAAREVSLSFSAWAIPPKPAKRVARTKAAEGELLLMDIKTPGVYRVRTATSEVESLQVVAPSAFVGVSDEHGRVHLRGLPPGEHRVTAWLPARGGADEQLVSAVVQVEAGIAAKSVLTLGAP